MSSMAQAWARTLRQRSRHPLAVYADPFDPITAGHLSVLEQAIPLFRQLVVVVTGMKDPTTCFSAKERLQLVNEVTAQRPQVSVDLTALPIVTYARNLGARFLLRGVRTAAEAADASERSRLDYLHAPEIRTLFVPLQERAAAVGSAELKDLARRGAALSRYCHPAVARRLRDRFTPNT